MVRLAGLSTESAWSYAVWPVDPATGERTRRERIAVLDDAASVDAFFAGEAG